MAEAALADARGDADAYTRGVAVAARSGPSRAVGDGSILWVTFPADGSLALDGCIFVDAAIGGAGLRAVATFAIVCFGEDRLARISQKGGSPGRIAIVNAAEAYGLVQAARLAILDG